VIDTLRAEAAAMQQAIDTYTAMCIASKGSRNPDTIAKRERLENSLADARLHLKRIKEQLL